MCLICECVVIYEYNYTFFAAVLINMNYAQKFQV